jgi:hypothetical protein
LSTNKHIERLLTSTQRQELEKYEHASFVLIRTMRGELHASRLQKEKLSQAQTDAAEEMRILLAAAMVNLSHNSRPLHDDVARLATWEVLEQSPQEAAAMGSIVDFLGTIASKGVIPEEELNEKEALSFLEEFYAHVFSILGHKVSRDDRATLQAPVF